MDTTITAVPGNKESLSAETASPQAKKALIAGMIGNVLEWYDFGVYVFFAPVIAKLFFPPQDQVAGMIAAYGVFAAGFLMRPVGAVLFGHYGDSHGRKNALVLSIILMAIPTVCMGLLPTYNSIGIWASILLTIMRLVQGTSLGGEYTGSVSYLVEHAPSNRRGLFGSWTTFSAIGGLVVGSLVGALLTKNLSVEVLYSWGWRLAFIGGVLIGIVGLYMRQGLHESEIFSEIKEKGEVTHAPVKLAIRHHLPELFTAVGLATALTSGFYVIYTYLVNYLATSGKIPLADALAGNTVSMLVLVGLIPVMGRISDSVGRKPMLIGAALFMLLFSYPLFQLALRGDVFSMVLAQSLFALSCSTLLGVVSTTLVEIFPANVRFTSVSLGYNLAIALFGGGAPWYATQLVRATGDPFVPAFYLMFCAVVTLFAATRIRETYRLALK